MKNKKLLAILSIVIVVCLLSTMFVGCKKDKDVDNREAALSAVIDGVQNAIATGDMTDLKVNGELYVKVNDSQKFKIKLNLRLALPQKGSSESAPNSRIEAEIQDGNGATVLGVYYYDDNKPNASSNTFSGNQVYLQYKAENGTQVKKRFPAPFVLAAMQERGASVDFSGIDLGTVISDNVGGILDVIVSLLDKDSAKVSANNAHFEINLATVLNDLVLGDDPDEPVIDLSDITQGLGLAADTKTLIQEVLPAINIAVDASLNNKVLTSVKLGLNVAKKDVVVSKVGNGGDLLVIKISKDLKIEAGLTFAVGSLKSFMPSDLTSYVRTANLIDVELAVDLAIPTNEGDNIIKLKLIDSPELALDLTGVKAAQFYIKLRMDPWTVVSLINNGIDFSSTGKIINSIKKIAPAIDEAQVKIIDKTTGANNASLVSLSIVKDEYNTQKISIALSSVISGLDKLAISGLPVDTTINTVIEVVNSFIKNDKDKIKVEEENEGQTTADEGIEIDTGVLGIVGNYLKGAYIGINDGTHAPIYASFNTNATGVIPFSGYTEFKGKRTGTNYTFYTLSDTKTEYAKVSSYDYEVKNDGSVEIPTYYVKNGENYEEAALQRAEAFSVTTDYYVVTDETGKDVITVDKVNYKKVVVTATEFAKTNKENSTVYFVIAEYDRNDKPEDMRPIVWKFDGSKDYYILVKSYVKVEDIASVPEATKVYVKGTTIDSNKDDAAFGIGLDAKISLFNNGQIVEIDATVKNMDVFGLPATITIKISGLTAKLFPPIAE